MWLRRNVHITTVSLLPAPDLSESGPAASGSQAREHCVAKYEHTVD